MPAHDDIALVNERRTQLQERRTEGNAYPNDFCRSHFSQDLHDQYGDKEKSALSTLNVQVAVAGRLMLDRGMFLVIQDMKGRIQLYVPRTATDISAAVKKWDLGDIVAAQGIIAKSNRGDLYVEIEKCQLLAKAIYPLPEKYHGLSDRESRYRQRYLDLIVNADTRKVFAVRTALIAAVRQYLSARDYMEVETPMLHSLRTGARAKAFETHHDSLQQKMYLRIAPELYLKRLIIGGLERVFELNRNFRNEGLSTQHNPEFTMLEFYQAFTHYRQLMDMIEDMLRWLSKNVLGHTALICGEHTYDLSPPFARMTLRSALQQEMGIDDVDDSAAMHKLALVHHIDPDLHVREIQVKLFEKNVEKKLHQPTFITHYPVEVSPLARRDPTDPTLTERFELFIGGTEVANGFSELNDPIDQVERFTDQEQRNKRGDDESMQFDMDYIRAMEHGMPPTAGAGIGIDRLVMLYTNQSAIRDVLLFPQLRDKNQDE